MTIAWDWLGARTSVAEVEAEIAETGASDVWLRGWAHLIEQMNPADELWEYHATEMVASMAASPEKFPGFEEVIDCETLERLEVTESHQHIVNFRSGFAVVRNNEILDWIEAPDHLR